MKSLQDLHDEFMWEQFEREHPDEAANDPSDTKEDE